MNLDKLGEDVRNHAREILKSKIDPVYKKIEKPYIAEWCAENKVEQNFTIEALLLPNGELSGLAKCSSCTNKLQES